MGEVVGFSVGDKVGAGVGLDDGAVVGFLVGEKVGTRVGLDVDDQSRVYLIAFRRSLPNRYVLLY